jgi:hypothetical protein
VKLYFEDNKSQQQIADLMGLHQTVVSDIIIVNKENLNADINVEGADKRRKLTDKDWVVFVWVSLKIFAFCSSVRGFSLFWVRHGEIFPHVLNPFVAWTFTHKPPKSSVFLEFSWRL